MTTIASSTGNELENSNVDVDSHNAPSTTSFHSVRVDPECILDDTVRRKFESLLEEYDRVFDPAFKGYNGAAGPFQAVVNMGSVQPPQRKSLVPQYSRHRLDELQQKSDDLERKGVFVKLEDVDIAVEYLTPSFLVKKRIGDFRLVTAFADIADIC